MEYKVIAGGHQFTVRIKGDTGRVIRQAINPVTGKPWQRLWYYDETTKERAMVQWLKLSTAARQGKPFQMRGKAAR